MRRGALSSVARARYVYLDTRLALAPCVLAPLASRPASGVGHLLGDHGAPQGGAICPPQPAGALGPRGSTPQRAGALGAPGFHTPARGRAGGPGVPHPSARARWGPRGSTPQRAGALGAPGFRRGASSLVASPLLPASWLVSRGRECARRVLVWKFPAAGGEWRTSARRHFHPRVSTLRVWRGRRSRRVPEPRAGEADRGGSARLRR